MTHTLDVRMYLIVLPRTHAYRHIHTTRTRNSIYPHHYTTHVNTYPYAHTHIIQFTQIRAYIHHYTYTRAYTSHILTFINIQIRKYLNAIYTHSNTVIKHKYTYPHIQPTQTTHTFTLAHSHTRSPIHLH